VPLENGAPTAEPERARASAANEGFIVKRLKRSNGILRDERLSVNEARTAREVCNEMEMMVYRKDLGSTW
jgi:hypothetical protein